jgi:hypothetical protein
MKQEEKKSYICFAESVWFLLATIGWQIAAIFFRLAYILNLVKLTMNWFFPGVLNKFFEFNQLYL